jgi:hypothetical protein
MSSDEALNIPTIVSNLRQFAECYLPTTGVLRDKKKARRETGLKIVYALLSKQVDRAFFLKSITVEALYFNHVGVNTIGHVVFSTRKVSNPYFIDVR